MEPTNPVDGTGPEAQSSTPTPAPVTPTPAPRPTPTTPRSKKRSWKAFLVGAIITLIVIVAVGATSLAYLARETRPEDSLYNTKINLYERALRFVHFSNLEKVSYDHARLESRLQELQTIATDRGTTSPAVVEHVGALIKDHTEDALDSLNRANPSLETRIVSLADIDTVLRASQTLVEQYEELGSSTAGIRDARNTLSDDMKTSLQTYGSTTASTTVKAFIGTFVEEVTAKLPNVANGSSAQQAALRRIEEMTEYVDEDKLTEALSAIIRARMSLDVDGYLYASERGEAPLPENVETATTTGQ